MTGPARARPAPYASFHTCRKAQPLYFLCGVSALVTLTVSAKLQSVISHLGAMGVMDYGDKLEAYAREQKEGFGKQSFVRSFVHLFIIYVTYMHACADVNER